MEIVGGDQIRADNCMRQLELNISDGICCQTYMPTHFQKTKQQHMSTPESNYS